MADRDGAGRWKKGSASPNPGGRPKETGDVRELAKSYTEAAVRTLAEIMENQESPAAARTAAASALLDRAWGRPASSLEGRVEVQHSIASVAAQTLMELTQRAQERKRLEAQVIDAEPVRQ